MPAVSTIALVTTAVIAATSATYQISESESQKRRVKGKEQEAGRQAKSLQDSAAARAANEESEAANREAQGAARKRQRRQAQSAQGFQSTLLTGASGLEDSEAGSGAGKTLLGA